jgi:hypothetical protein
MKAFRIPSHVPVLYYVIHKNVAICDFRECCLFIQDLFCCSFPPEKKLQGKIIFPGVKFSSSQWKRLFKINNNKKMIEMKYTKDIAVTNHAKASVIHSDFIPFHLLFQEINNVNELYGDSDKSIYNNIINTYNIYTLEDFHQCVRLRVHSLLLIV